MARRNKIVGITSLTIVLATIAIWVIQISTVSSDLIMHIPIQLKSIQFLIVQLVHIAFTEMYGGSGEIFAIWDVIIPTLIIVILLIGFLSSVLMILNVKGSPVMLAAVFAADIFIIIYNIIYMAMNPDIFSIEKSLIFSTIVPVILDIILLVLLSLSIADWIKERRQNKQLESC